MTDSVSSVSGTAEEEECKLEGPGPDRVDRMDRAPLSGGALGERSISGNEGKGRVGAGNGNAFKAPMESEVRRDLTWLGELDSSVAFSEAAGVTVSGFGSSAPAH